MKIHLVQNAPTLSRNNLSAHKEHIDKARSERVDLVLFPELSLSGYKLMDSVYEMAYTKSELQEIAACSDRIDIALGCALREDNKIYNAALYFSDGEIRHIHRKKMLPNYGMFEEARYYFAGNMLESFKAGEKRLMMLICEDLWSGGNIDKIATEKPDLVLVLSNSPARDFRDEGLLIQEQWTALLKTAAILTGAYVVFANRVGFEDGIGFWGGSCIVSPQGEVEHQLPLFETAEQPFELDNNLSRTRQYILRH